MNDRALPIIRAPRGRGAAGNPKNRFERLHLETDAEVLAGRESVPTRFYRDPSRSAITRNDSPDVGFEFSLNPYRGCEHGCIYCYARPTHEYLGWSAGLDFESRILVKENAPELLRAELTAPRWKPATIALSGVTDPYQPADRTLQVTRRCLEVLAEFRNPVSIITKNHLVTRDVDILGEMASHRAARVNLSITSLDRTLQSRMEPRTATPQRRLEAVRTLSGAGIPVGVMVAPVIPGLTDHEIPSILEAARDAGATAAGFVLLRLPHGVSEIFAGWLERHYPNRRDKVLNRVREMRGGTLNDSRFGSRMRGEGVFAEQVRALFETSCRRLGLNEARATLSTEAFRRPARGGQLGLFDG